VHGPSCARGLDPKLQRQLLDEGFLAHEADATRGFFPEWYRTSYQTPEQVRDTFGQSFRVLGLIPQGLVEYQDLVILQNRE
jgi:hypothetical protein